METTDGASTPVGRIIADSGSPRSSIAAANIEPSSLTWSGDSALNGADPYGLVGVAQDGLAIGYRAELHLGDGLVHLRNREYDPTTGQFVTVDPIDGIDGEVIVANGYHYANNNPNRYHDPFGLQPSDLDMGVLYEVSAAQCFARGGNIFLPAEIQSKQGCFSYDPCVADGWFGYRHVVEFGCDHRELLLDILQVAGTVAVATLCAGGGAGVASGAASAACGGVAYRFMDNRRNGEWFDGVFDPQAIATDAAIGASVAGLLSLGRLLIVSRAAGQTHLSDDVAREVDHAIHRATSGSNVRFPGHDGKVFVNRGNILPPKPSGYYTEWTAAASGAKRGMHRVIIGGNPRSPDAIYYWDHTNAPVRIR